MKTNFLITSLIIVFFTLTANSQIAKSNWMVGGDGNYSIHTYNGVGLISLSINPDIGYFIKDKLVIGSNLNYIYYGSSERSSSRTIGIGVFTRYYFLKPQKTFNLFSQVHYNYNNYKSYTASSSTNFHKYGVKSGAVVFFTNSVGLEVSIQYDNSISSNSTNSTYLIGNIGFHIHLEKK